MDTVSCAMSERMIGRLRSGLELYANLSARNVLCQAVAPLVPRGTK